MRYLVLAVLVAGCGGSVGPTAAESDQAFSVGWESFLSMERESRPAVKWTDQPRGPVLIDWNGVAAIQWTGHITDSDFPLVLVEWKKYLMTGDYNITEADRDDAKTVNLLIAQRHL